MAKRLFTSDWHLGMSSILAFEKRGIEYGGRFKNVDKMNEAYIRSACQRAKADDTIIHVGDLCSYKADRGSPGLATRPDLLITKIPATFINIRGNHDANNKVVSLCESMRIRLGKRYPNVSLSHYPSYDTRSIGHWISGDIHICGHVHSSWKHCLDLDNQVLNINVGVDVWNQQIVTEDELIQYINLVLRLPQDKITTIKKIKGKITYV